MGRSFLAHRALQVPRSQATVLMQPQQSPEPRAAVPKSSSTLGQPAGPKLLPRCGVLAEAGRWFLTVPKAAGAERALGDLGVAVWDPSLKRRKDAFLGWGGCSGQAPVGSFNLNFA